MIVLGNLAKLYKEQNMESSKKILHLTLKKKWFDMIASGEKKEEYREMKSYWITRLWDIDAGRSIKWDVVRFRNGYSKDAPTMDVEFLETTTGHGREEWGGSGHTFIILLGKVLNTSNYNQ